MKLAGNPGRMELHPESAEEKQFLQGMLDVGSNALLFWGDADEAGGAFIVNNTPPAGPPSAEAPEPLAA